MSIFSQIVTNHWYIFILSYYQKKILAQAWTVSFKKWRCFLGSPGFLSKSKGKGDKKRRWEKVKVSRIPRAFFLPIKGNICGHLPQFSHLATGSNSSGERSFLSESTDIVAMKTNERNLQNDICISGSNLYRRTKRQR